MSDDIGPIDPTTRATIDPAGDWWTTGHQPSRIEHQRTRVAPRQLGIGAPADQVEISLNPETIRLLSERVHLRFLVDAVDHRVVVQIIETETDEVIRQIPAEGLREALRQMSRQVGLSGEEQRDE